MNDSDRALVVETLVGYCALLDARRPERLVAEVFDADVELDYGVPVDDVRAFFRRLLAPFSATAHLLSNVRVLSSDVDTATTHSYVSAYHWLAKAETEAEPGRDADFHLIAQYHDELRRVDDGWRIVRRRARPLGVASGAEAWSRYVGEVLS